MKYVVLLICLNSALAYGHVAGNFSGKDEKLFKLSFLAKERFRLDLDDDTNKVYAQLGKVLTGVKYKSENDTLYFAFYEEYMDSDDSLEYTVFDTRNNEKVLNNTIQPLTSAFGDNRKELDISSLDNGTYILEVLNEKKERFYLRFIKE